VDLEGRCGQGMANWLDWIEEGGRGSAGCMAGWLEERYICWALLLSVLAWGAECCVRYFCQPTSGICDYYPHALKFEQYFEETKREYAIWLMRRSRGIPRTVAVGRGICVRPAVLFSPSLSISTSSDVGDWTLFSSSMVTNCDKHY
jgi:hypothetical protein